MRRSILLSGFLALAPLGFAGPAAADPTGSWTTPKGAVSIADCGQGLCATITSLKKPKTEAGEPMRDINNPDEAKRSRPIVGLSVLSGMKRDGERWTGQVYNPEDGRTYKAYMTEDGADRLEIQGCALGGLVCKSQTWNRAK